MAKTALESYDVKKLEKMFKRQLAEIEVDKECLENRLENKTIEVKQLQMQYRTKQVSHDCVSLTIFLICSTLNSQYDLYIYLFLQENFERLSQEKRHLERLLEAEVMNAYFLACEVDKLKRANKRLQIDIDHMILDH